MCGLKKCISLQIHTKLMSKSKGEYRVTIFREGDNLFILYLIYLYLIVQWCETKINLIMVVFLCIEVVHVFALLGSLVEIHSDLTHAN